MIVRDEKFRAAYLAWDFSPEKKKLLYWILDQYGIYASLPDEVDKGIDFLNTSSSMGFVLHFKKKDFGLAEIDYFFDYLKNKFIGNEYRISVSDRRAYSKGKYVEQVERHYLKPRHVMGQDEKIDQQFGNISILLTYRNDEYFNLKCSATAYPDRGFAEAKNFDQFMDLIAE